MQSDRGPMRGRRVKLAKCPVEGHSGCELELSAESPPSRSDEKRAWKLQASMEIVEDD